MISQLNAINCLTNRDSVIGKWELTRTVCQTGKDSVVSTPSSAPLGTTNAWPESTITLDSSGSYVLYQFCLKCPLLKWDGKYEVAINDNGLSMIVLQNNRRLSTHPFAWDKFSGTLSIISPDQIRIENNSGCVLTLERKNN